MSHRIIAEDRMQNVRTRELLVFKMHLYEIYRSWNGTRTDA